MDLVHEEVNGLGVHILYVSATLGKQQSKTSTRLVDSFYCHFGGHLTKVNFNI